jgi:hypothetical protein
MAASKKGSSLADLASFGKSSFDIVRVSCRRDLHLETVVFNRKTPYLVREVKARTLATTAGAVGDKSGLWVIRGTPDSVP